MTSPSAPLTGSIVALVTPMHEDGSVDYPALRKLIDWHITEGTDCIGVVGTTGESPTVNVEEHCEIIRVAVEQAAKRVPIMAGCGANSTREAIDAILEGLAWLGITPSHSRPRVSDDNAYAESLFRTAKYRPEFPAKGFADLDDARAWAADFVQWYNVDHRHSGIRYVSPTQRHAGEDHAILAARHALYAKARELNPARWSGNTRNWSPIGPVTLNPERDCIVKSHSAGNTIQPLAA